MKIKILFNKFIALMVSICLLICITSFDAFAFSEDEYFSQYQKVNSLPLVSPENGKVTSINDTGSDLTVVNIQDLHCHKETQKKISNIIEEINKENKINKIYIEGGYGNIDISWLNKIEDKKIKEQVLEQLLEDGEITAGEYYAALKNNTVQLKGLDERKIHQKNIERLSKIIDNREKYDSVIQKVRIEISRLNKMYVNLENRRFSQEINAYKQNGGDSGQLYIKLFKYIDKINNNFDKYNNITKISKKDYPNMAAYIVLDEESKKISPKEIGAQIQSVLMDLKSVLSYEQYSEMISKTNNLKDLTKLAWYINKYTTEKNIDLVKYGTLGKFLNIRKINDKLNPVELVEEERNLIEQIRYAVSYDRTEYEVAFLSDFEEYFEKYLNYGLTSEDWSWTKKGFEKFRQLYAKYAVIDRIKEIEDDFSEINKYYDVNDKRNSIFVDNILDGEKTAVKIKKPGIRTSKEIIKDSKEVIIVIAGGYHSKELSNILSKKSVNDIIVTPNISGSVEKANNKYKQTITEQAIIDSQALAFRLASCSDDATQQKLLLKAGIETIKKNNNGIVNEEKIKDVIKVIKNNDKNNNIDIQYENENFKLKLDGEEILIGLDEIETISNENNEFESAINAVVEFFKDAIKVFDPESVNTAYNATISRLIFSVAVVLSNSNGLPAFETEKWLAGKDIIIDGKTYSFEEFLFLPYDTQARIIRSTLSQNNEEFENDINVLEDAIKNNKIQEVSAQANTDNPFTVNYISLNYDGKKERDQYVGKKEISKKLDSGEVIDLSIVDFLGVGNDVNNFAYALTYFFNRANYQNGPTILDEIKDLDDEYKEKVLYFLYESFKNAFYHGNKLDINRPIYIWLEKSSTGLIFKVANEVNNTIERDVISEEKAAEMKLSGKGLAHEKMKGWSADDNNIMFEAGEKGDYYVSSLTILAGKESSFPKLSIFDNKKSYIAEEFVFGTVITALLAVFMVSNPFGWLTGIVAGGLFLGSRLGFVGAHSAAELYRNWKNKDNKIYKKANIWENFKARLFPTIILSVPYALVLFSGFGTFLPALALATGVAMFFHGYWNYNEETIKKYLSKIPFVKNLSYLKMSIGEERNYDLLKSLPLKDPFGGINNSFNIEMFPNVMNKLYSILSVLRFVSLNNVNERYVLDSMLKKIKNGEISKAFIETIIKNNENADVLSNDDLKALCMGVLVILYPEEMNRYFEEKGNIKEDVSLGNFINDVIRRINGDGGELPGAEFAEGLPKNAVANANFGFNHPKNMQDSEDNPLKGSKTIIRLLANIAHEIGHIELFASKKITNENGEQFLPEFFCEVNSVKFILECMKLCKDDSEKEMFKKYLPVSDEFSLFSYEHSTARAFNKIFFDVCGEDVSKWNALKNIIFSKVTDNEGDTTPIQYIEDIIKEMKIYKDEQGNKVFTDENIKKIEKEMITRSWQYSIYKMVEDNDELKKEINKKVKTGEIEINIENSNKSVNKKDKDDNRIWLYPGYEYLGSKEPSAELINIMLNYYKETNNNEEVKKIKKLAKENKTTIDSEEQIKEFFNDNFVNKICINNDIANYKFYSKSEYEFQKPHMYSVPDMSGDNINRNRYKAHVLTKERELMENYDFDALYNNAENYITDRKKIRLLNYFRIMQNEDNNDYLKNIIEDTSEDIEIRLLAYGYFIKHDGNNSQIKNLNNLIFETKKMIRDNDNEYINGIRRYNIYDKNAKNISNYIDLRAVCVGVTLILLNETDSKNNFLIELNEDKTKKLYRRVLGSNIFNIANRQPAANAGMDFGIMPISTIAHEVGHNIFNYKWNIDEFTSASDPLQNETLWEVSAYACSNMFMQIIYKNDYDPIFNKPLSRYEEGPFKEAHAAAKGLLDILFISSNIFGIEMFYIDFFQMLLVNQAVKEIIDDLFRHKVNPQNKFLEELISVYFSWTLNSWEYFVVEIFEYLIENNKNLSMLLFDPNQEGLIELQFKESLKNRYGDRFEYMIQFLEEKIKRYNTVKANVDSAINDNYIPAYVYSQEDLDRAYKEYVYTVLNIYLLLQTDNFALIGKFIETNMNVLSEKEIIDIPFEILKSKGMNTDNLNANKLTAKQVKELRNIVAKLSEEDRNILLKLIIVKDELNAVDKYILQVFFDNKGIEQKIVNEWLKDTNISNEYQFQICKFFETGRGNLSCGERNRIINIINDSSIEKKDKDKIVAKLNKEQEMIIKVKILGQIINEYVLKNKEKFIRMEDVNDITVAVLDEISGNESVSETDLEVLIDKEIAEKITNEQTSSVPTAALLPQNQKEIYEFMERNNFQLSFTGKLKKAIQMAWKEFSPSLYSNFSKFHFTKDKSAAQNLQKITLLSAVISALTAGITMFWLNPAESSVMFVRLGIWAFSVIGITSVITFLTNIISHSYIVYNFMKEIEQNKIDNETGENIREKLEKIIYKTEGSVTIDLSNDEFDINNEDARKKLKNEIEKFVENCDKEGRTGEIIINNDQKEGLRHYSIGISDNYLNNLSDKKISVYVKEGNTKILLNDAAGFDSSDSKSAILFDTEEYVNKAVLDGKSSLITALGVAVKEFLEVYKAGSFYKGHKGTESRLRALMLSSASYLIPGIIGVAGILMPAIPLTTVLIAFIVSIFATNIGLHILMDFKSIKARQEMLDKMANDVAIDIELKGNKTQANKGEEVVMPVYVISEDLGKLGYDSKELKNTGIKTAKGESVFAVETEGAIVLGTRSGAGAKEIAQVLNESKVLKELIKDKISGKIQVSDMDIIVEDEKYIEQKQKEKDFKGSDIIFEEGIMIVKELKGQSRQEIMEEFKKLSEVKQAIGITLADKMIISLEDIKDIEKLNTAIKTGKARKVITRQQSEQLGIGEKELLEIRKKGIEVYIKEGEKVIEFDTRKEIETEAVSGNITMQQLQQKIINSEKPLLIGIEKLAGMFKSNQADIIETYSMFETLIGNFKMNFGIGQLKQKDVEAMAYNVRYEEIPVSWEDLKESSEIKIMYNNIGEGLKEVFKGAIEERILAKQEIGENRLSDKKLERLLGKMLKKQKEKKIGKKKFNYEDDEKFTIEDGKREIYEIMAERNINEIEDEESILKIIELIPVVADRQMSISEEISREDIAKDYRAMLSAA